MEKAESCEQCRYHEKSPNAWNGWMCLIGKRNACKKSIEMLDHSEQRTAAAEGKNRKAA